MEDFRLTARRSYSKAIIHQQTITYQKKAPAIASVLILRASLLDSVIMAVTTLIPIHFQVGHWRKLATFGEVEIYENLKALPRARFVSGA
jgi:hypothetical protein